MANQNLRKAAILLRSLPPKQAAAMLAKLTPEQAAAVSGEIAQTGRIEDSDKKAIIREFVATEFETVRPYRTPNTPPFAFLHDIDCRALLDFLADEQPQTVALILSFLLPRTAAAVLAELPTPQQMGIICRIATMSEPDMAVVRDVEIGLRKRMAHGRREVGQRGVAGVIRMLYAMDPTMERQILSELNASEPQLGRAISQAMFGEGVPNYSESSITGAAC
jgi:flagellar motor switch protein FliG